jgi:hypothetical protein
MSKTFVLPDGRILAVSMFDESGGESPHLGPVWEMWITPGSPREAYVGHPTNSALAELLAYRIAHEEWPGWIDDLATEIERAFGVSS